MKRIGLVVHCGSAGALDCAALAAAYLTDMGATVTAEEEAAGLLSVPSFAGTEPPEAVLSLLSRVSVASVLTPFQKLCLFFDIQ